MVQRVFLTIGLLVFGSAGGLACLSTENEFGSHVIGGSTPILVSSDPAEAGPGTSIEIIGSGFSIVAVENIVSIGGAAAAASEYTIDNDDRQVLIVDIPAGAPEGEQSLFVIVNGTPSNVLNFTVTP